MSPCGAGFPFVSVFGNYFAVNFIVLTAWVFSVFNKVPTSNRKGYLPKQKLAGHAVGLP